MRRAGSRRPAGRHVQHPGPRGAAARPARDCGPAVAADIAVPADVRGRAAAVERVDREGGHVGAELLRNGREADAGGAAAGKPKSNKRYYLLYYFFFAP